MRRLWSSQWLFGLLLLGLAVQSLSPIGALERVGNAFSGPLRAGIQLIWPLRAVDRLGQSAVRAAERGSSAAERAAAAAEDEARAGRLLRELFFDALPADPALLAGRRVVPAEVIGRSSRDRDQIVIRTWRGEGLSVGQPVVWRDHFLGRVESVESGEGDRSVLRVRLITDPAERVGAALLPPDDAIDPGLLGYEPVDLVVGGIVLDEPEVPAGSVSAEQEGSGSLDQGTSEGREESPQRAEPGRSRKVRLMAHHPERWHAPWQSEGLSGEVVVRELLPELDPFHQLVNGYRLGTMARTGGDGVLRVDTQVDYLDGLYHVAVLTPGQGGARVQAQLAVEPEHPLSESRWLRVRAVTPGDPSAWRRSLQLNRGVESGVRTGAAVISGAYLVGRIHSAGPLGAEMHPLTEPGCSVLAAAAPLDGASQPRIMGRLISLGRESVSGRPLLSWRAHNPLDRLPHEAPGDTRTLELFTGTGEPGLPAGLLLGTAEVPVGEPEDGVHVFALDGAPDPQNARGPLWVRLPDELDEELRRLGGAR
ncbi:MAG: rod shape-determining protein MreC [Planctomycetota bacterium]|jgi:hypothetical protein